MTVTRRNAVSPETRALALEHYESAKKKGIKDPLSHVGELLDVARSTAHNYITQARACREAVEATIPPELP